MHHDLIELAEKHTLPIIDLHSYVRTKENTGILWWDHVHFSDYGHELAAQYISDTITDLFFSDSNQAPNFFY